MLARIIRISNGLEVTADVRGATYNPALSAGVYAAFGMFLAGVAVTCVVIYLGQQRARDGNIHKLEAAGQSEVEVKGEYATSGNITASLLYAIAGLVACSFLYGSLSGHGQSEAASIVMILNGAVFGLSVLSLFYSLTLMMLQNPATKHAARPAYWIVVSVGPALVMRFQSSASFHGWQIQCDRVKCEWSWWSSPAAIGLGLVLLLLIASVVIARVEIPEGGRLEQLRDKLAQNVVLAPAIAFWLAAGTIIASLLVTTTEIMTNAFFNYGVQALAFVVLAGFAIACSCVIGSRLPR